MDKGPWPATVHGVARVGRNLVTKPPSTSELLTFWLVRNYPVHCRMFSSIPGIYSPEVNGHPHPTVVTTKNVSGHSKWGFPGGTSSNEPPANTGDVRCKFRPWIGKIPWRRTGQPTPVLLPRESHGQRSLAGCRAQGRKEWDTTEVT